MSRYEATKCSPHDFTVDLLVAPRSFDTLRKKMRAEEEEGKKNPKTNQTSETRRACTFNRPSARAKRRGLTVAKLGRCPALRCLDVHLLVVFPGAVLHPESRSVTIVKLGVEGIFRIQIHIVQHNGALKKVRRFPGKKRGGWEGEKKQQIKGTGGKQKTDIQMAVFSQTPPLSVNGPRQSV